MRLHRTIPEVITDEALTLSLLAEVEDAGHGAVIDRLRLQKLIFLIAYDWFSRRWKGFNYTFFRYRHGPFTRDLYQTEIDLAQAGLIVCEKGWALRLSQEGRVLARELREAVWRQAENEVFWASLLQHVESSAGLSLQALLDRVYTMEVVPLGWQEAWPLAEVPLGVDLTRIIEEEEATAILVLPPDWMDTFGLYIARGGEGADVLAGNVIQPEVH